MPQLRAETILETLNTQLQALVPSIVASCDRNYPYSIDDSKLPSLQIVMGNDTPVDAIPNNLNFEDWRLQVYIDVIVKSATIPLETELNTIRLAVHKNIMSNYTLGLSFVQMTYPDAVTEPEQKTAGELPVSVMRLSFTIQYRTGINDPSA